jgi:thiol-disulfide isomerase/thioredoxin
MKTIAPILLSLAACAALSSAQNLPHVDESNFAKTVAAHKGKVVLVEFWATWCVPCREEMPQLVKLEQKLRPRGLDVVMISVDAPEDEAKAAKVLKDTGMPAEGHLRTAKDDDNFCMAIDPAWASGAVPAIFIYNRSGKRVKSFIGATPMKDVEAALEKVF